jgi:predicted nucleotidyltransferase
MPTDFTSVFRVLLAARVRFIVVGGLAVLLHGIDRLTADMDLVVDLAPPAVGEAMAALLAAGFRPMAPVDAMEFADPAQRAAWKRDRGMEVFSLWDPTNRRPTVDVFLEPPIPFETLWNASIEVKIGDLAIRLASIAHLIQMKQATGRPKDLEDVTRLKALASRLGKL